MTPPKGIPLKLQPWFEARRRFKLSDAHIQMARELGLNPKKFGSLANERQEPWKMPLPDFIIECYRKRFGRSSPEHVCSLEELVRERELKHAQKVRRAPDDEPANGGQDG
jgi:hypothetical protein